MVEEDVSIRTSGAPMPTFVARPQGNRPFPVVIVYMDALGFRENHRHVARRLAESGFYAAVPDLYYRFGSKIVFDAAKVAAGDELELGRCVAMMQRLSDAMAMSDTVTLIQAMRKDPAATDDEMGCMGFCMGGRFVLRALAQLPEHFVAGSALHPTYIVTDRQDSPHRSLASVRGELYLGFGAEDQITPVDTIPPLRAELDRLGISANIDVHEAAGHGYMLRGEPTYLEAAAEPAWQRTLELFHRRLDAPVVTTT